MIAKLLLQTLIWVVVMGALLFVPAGTLHWPAAWVFLGTMAILGVAAGLWLAKTDPALLAERLRPMMQRDQPAADKKFMLAFGFVALIWFLAIGLDKRYHPSDVPLALQVPGWAMLLLSTGFIMWVMRENSFAAPVVKLQTERGHRVISTGPYALGAPSHVHRHHSVLRGRAAAVGLVLGRGDVAAVGCAVRRSR